MVTLLWVAAVRCRIDMGVLLDTSVVRGFMRDDEIESLSKNNVPVETKGDGDEFRHRMWQL